MHIPLTRLDLARITIRVAAVAAARNGSENLDIAFGHVRETYLPFFTKPGVRNQGYDLVFSEQDWEVLADLEALWETILSEVGCEQFTLRITVPIREIPLAEWNVHMTSSDAHTMCFGQAMRSFAVLP